MNELFHHGVIGQKWGVWNDDTRARYSGGRRHIKKSTKQSITEAKSKNIEKWGKDKRHNVLYVTGLSGSGKSTVTEGLRDKNTNIIHLDYYTNAGNNYATAGHRDSEFNAHLKKTCPEYYDKYDGELPPLSKMNEAERKEFWSMMDNFQDAIITFGQKQYPNKKVIVEGVQLADETLFPDKMFFKDQPLLVLSTDAETSTKRAFERDGIEMTDAETLRIRTKMQDTWQKSVDNLVSTTEAKTGQLYVSQLLYK